MILSENSSTLGSRCCSAARSETEWQRNESWKVRLLELPPKLNMQARERRPPQVRAPCSSRCFSTRRCNKKVRFATVGGVYFGTEDCGVLSESGWPDVYLGNLATHSILSMISLRVLTSTWERRVAGGRSLQ